MKAFGVATVSAVALLVVVLPFLGLEAFASSTGDLHYSAKILAASGGGAILLGALLSRVAPAAALGAAFGGGVSLAGSGLGALFLWRDSMTEVFWGALAALVLLVVLSWIARHTHWKS